MRVLVQIFHIGVFRRVVEVVVVLLDVFAVVAFRAGQTEEPLLQNGIFLIPKGDREAERLVPVTDAGNAILIPPVSARSCVIVREIVPGVSCGTVVLAHGAPGALAQIRPPALPMFLSLVTLHNAKFFFSHRLSLPRTGDWPRISSFIAAAT